MSNCNNNTNIGDTVKLVSDIRRDAGLLHEVVHSDKNEMVVDAGKRKTLKGLTEYLKQVIAENGYKVPVEYAAGLSVSEPHFTVIHDGIVYAPRPDLLPFDTVEPFNPDQWLTLQGLTSIRLGMEDGSSLVGSEYGNQRDVNRISNGYSYNYNPLSSNFKIVFRHSSGDVGVITKGLNNDAFFIRARSGNAVDPSIPEESENKKWDLFRTTYAYSLHKVFIYKSPKATGLSLIDVPLAVIGGDKVVAGVPLRYVQIKSTDTTVVSEKVKSGFKGLISIAFLASPNSSRSQSLRINNVLHTVDLSSETSTLRVFEFYASRGENNVSIDTTDSKATINLIGFNFMEIGDINDESIDIDTVSYYTKSPNYISHRGASDYAFMSGKNKLWAGSYHGGESKIDEPIFYVDDGILDISGDFISVTRKFNVLQNNKIEWSSGEFIKIQSMTEFGDATVSMRCNAYECNARVVAAFLGMTTTSTEFKRVLSSNAFFTTSNGQYPLGPCYHVTQLNESSGRMVTSMFTKPPFIESDIGGTYVAYSSGNYAKVYSGFVKAQYANPPVLPDRFSWVFTRVFH
ncbi:MAG: hypothetical protein KBC57_03160 [Neisseriaceae bacterium]|nr:hypothetical protein [Neisseriaceae bacterium]